MTSLHSKEVRYGVSITLDWLPKEYCLVFSDDSCDPVATAKHSKDAEDLARRVMSAYWDTQGKVNDLFPGIFGS